MKLVSRGAHERCRGASWFLCLLCFRHGASAAKAGVPRTGRRVQSNLIILSCAVEMGQTEGWSGSKQRLSFRRRAKRGRRNPLPAPASSRWAI